jgi:transcriptional regulator GlxA family with amidase domain
MATLNVGFILARRITLCVFANFADFLRLSADESDRSRPILCKLHSDTLRFLGRARRRACAS